MRLNSGLMFVDVIRTVFSPRSYRSEEDDSNFEPEIRTSGLSG